MYKVVLNTFGDGINTGLPPFQIGESEATYLRNMDSREYPAATVRPPRSTYATVLSTNVNALGQRNNATLHVVDGNTWKYWVPASSTYTTVTTSLTSTETGEFAEFATGTERYTLFMNSTQKKLWDGSSTAIDLGDANTPFTKIFTVHKGRIYAARDNDIKYCALNKTSDWTTADDAGSIDITRAKGPITGLYEYNDFVIAWTEFSMHELHGTGPDNYELIDIEGDVGCISDRSIIRCNRRLYWLWHDGVYEYDGSSPVKVSSPVDDYISSINFDYKEKCVAGAIGDFLYLSIPYGSGVTQNNLILKFDTRLRKWFVETGNFIDFVTIGNALYGVDTNGQIWNMRDTSATEGLDSATPISWEFITKPFNEKAIAERKTVYEMYLVADVSTGSTSFTIGYSTNVENNDSTSFTTLVSVSGSSNVQNQRIQVPLAQINDVNWYRLRFAGTGQATIHYLQKNMRIKTR
jgi:hypothetical protein